MTAKEKVFAEFEAMTGIDFAAFFGNRPTFRGPVLHMSRKIAEADYFKLVDDIVLESKEPPCVCKTSEWFCVRDEEGWQVYVFVPAPSQFLGKRQSFYSVNEHCGKPMVVTVRCIVMECETCNAQVLELTPVTRPIKGKDSHYTEHILCNEMCSVCAEYVNLCE